MKISIITVSYNSEKTIEQTILSVLGQDYNNIEFIIIDGNSTDSTQKIIEKYRSQISKVIIEKDNGIYDAMNKGIKIATGDVIGILNSDDEYFSNKAVSAIVNKFKHEEIDALYADLVYVQEENTSKIVRYWKSGKYSEGKFMWGWMPPHPTFYVKKTIYGKFGLYHSEMKSAADYEMMLRLIHKNKIKIGYLEEIVVKMRVGGISNSSIQNRIRAHREDYKAWELNNLKPYFFTLFLKPLSKLTQFLFK